MGGLYEIMVTILTGDCLNVMTTLAADSVDSIVTDPPYGLSFMGKDWDHGVPGVHFWIEALRVAKPGAYLLAFGGTRTFHRLAVAIEDAGWEMRDCVMWVYGSGFPKSHDVSKGIDKEAGAEREIVGADHSAARRNKTTSKFSGCYGDINDAPSCPVTAPATDSARQWQGWGTALKPAWEPIIVARKPLIGTVAANVLKYGTGAMNIDGGRVACGTEHMRGSVGAKVTESDWKNNSGFGKPFVATDSPLGRWPANIIHDGSEEVLAGFPQSKAGSAVSGNEPSKTGEANCYGEYDRVPFGGHGDSGSAARFFYCAKASKQDRDEGCESIESKQRDEGRKEGNPGGDNPRNRGVQQRNNFHPTVKPAALMRYLCKLVTPPNGVILDPFMGSGSTGKAAVLEGFNFIGVEIDAEYCAIARARIEAQQGLFARTA